MILKWMKFIVIITIKEVYNRSLILKTISIEQALGNERHFRKLV